MLDNCISQSRATYKAMKLKKEKVNGYKSLHNSCQYTHNTDAYKRWGVLVLSIQQPLASVYTRIHTSTAVRVLRARERCQVRTGRCNTTPQQVHSQLQRVRGRGTRMNGDPQGGSASRPASTANLSHRQLSRSIVELCAEFRDRAYSLCSRDTHPTIQYQPPPALQPAQYRQTSPPYYRQFSSYACRGSATVLKLHIYFII